ASAKGHTTVRIPVCDKSPSQHCAAGRGPTVLACPPNGGQLVFLPMLSASQSHSKTPSPSKTQRCKACRVLDVAVAGPRPGLCPGLRQPTATAQLGDSTVCTGSLKVS